MIVRSKRWIPIRSTKTKVIGILNRVTGKKSDLDSVLKSRKSPMGRIRPNGQLALSEAGQAGSGSRNFWNSCLNWWGKYIGPRTISAGRLVCERGLQVVDHGEAGCFFVVDHEAGRIRLQAHRSIETYFKRYTRASSP